MTAATTYSSGGIILQAVTFTYDVFDRRIAKTVDADGAGPQAPETTYTAYDGHNAWADFDEAGTVIARYLFGNGIDQILARFQPGEGTAWYLTDHLGSIRDIINSLGALIDTITYDSFGNIITETNAAMGDRFKFTGREWDPELALYYYRARFYDPATGTFVSQDPLGFGAGDANLYRYVGNSPLMYVDPLGLEGGIYAYLSKHAEQIAATVGGAVVGYVCGYLRAKHNGSLTPHQDALREMLIGAAIGYVLGKVFTPGFLLFAGVAGAIWAYSRSENPLEDLKFDAKCLVAEILASGGAKGVVRLIRSPSSRKAFVRAIRNLLKHEHGSVPLGPRMDDSLLLRPNLNKNNMQPLTEWRRSIPRSNIKAERIKFLGENSVKIDDGTWRSLDGTRQFRVVPSDYLGNHPIGQPPVPDVPHVHFEFLAPPNPGGSNLRVLKNVHVPLS